MPDPGVSEAERAREIAGYWLDDWTGDARFDAIVELLRNLCDVPIALVSLVESERQRFLGKTGLDADETPRSMSFCAHAMLLPEVMVIPDATRDPRFADNPLVTGDPHIRFYAGAPLVSHSGVPLGALCVIDTKPRAGLTAIQAQTLRVLASNVVAVLEARREAEARTLIARELAHRIKNLFSVISGLANFSSREADSEKGWAVFGDRLAALAGAHDLVLSASQDPHGAGLALHGVIGRIFAPYAGREERVRIAGSDVMLKARDTTGIALVLHELATNAVKYGALAAGEGAVDIAIRSDATSVEIDWRERGGPSVVETRGEAGFGTRLIDTVVTRQLMGAIDREWNADGLAVRIRLPWTGHRPAD